MALAHRLLQAGLAPLLRLVGDQRVVHFVPGGQHGLAVGDGRFLLARLAQVQVAAQAPAIEQRQAQRRAEGEPTRVPAQAAQLQGLEAGITGQGNTRVEIPGGHPHLGRGRVKRRFGTPHVRAALGQLAGQADRYLRRADRHGRHVGTRQARLEALRRLRQQQAEGVDQLRLTLLQRWQAGIDGGYLGDTPSGRLGDLQLGGNTFGQARLVERMAAPGNLQAVAGDAQRVLRSAQLDIVARGVSQYREQHVALRLLCHLHVGVGGLHFAAQAAPQIQLPGRVQAALPEAVGRTAGVAGRIVEPLLAVACAVVARRGIQFRPLLRRHHTARGAALFQSRESAAHIQVLGSGALDQRAQLRVAETVPPLRVNGQAHRRAAHVGGRRQLPVVIQARLRPNEVRPDGAGAQAQAGQQHPGMMWHVSSPPPALRPAGVYRCWPPPTFPRADAPAAADPRRARSSPEYAAPPW